MTEEEINIVTGLEYSAANLPAGINIIDNCGQTIFEIEGKRVCYLEKRLIYRVDLDEIEPTVEAVGKRITEAIEDFNAKTGTANSLG